MHIERVRQIHSGEPEKSGLYDYEYDIYRFIDSPRCLVARSYTDEPDGAHFLGMEENGCPRALTDADLAHPMFLMAKAHLSNEGRSQL